MMLEPSAVVLYVTNLIQSSQFYIAQPQTSMAFGYTFLALNPDGNRLRFVSLRKS